MNIEEIDAALSLIRQEPKIKQGTKVLLSLETTTYVLDAIDEALTTLRDLKQELKENENMPNKIWVKKDDLSFAVPDIMGIDLSKIAIEFTRTTPTLKKIMGDS